jgi:hypothetical protein
MGESRENQRKWRAACRLVGLFAFAMGYLVGSGHASAAAPLLSKVSITSVTATSATISAEVNPQGKKTIFRFEYGSEDCASEACTIALEGSIPAASPPVPEATTIEGLKSGTLYHLRIVATNNEGEAIVERTFATLLAPQGGLPDGRAYEQASPVNKDGGDVLGDVPTIKATFNGNGITFDSTFGIPGGKGAQEFPTYLGSRGSSNWSTQGLLPPPSAGERAQVIGWSPNYTEVFSNVTRLGPQRVSALVEQDTSGGAPVQITPYVPNTDFYFSGESQDGSVVLFETRAKLTANALSEFPNLYAWDRETGQITLAGVTNQETSPPKGTIAGAYEWTEGITAQSLRLGGSFRGFYLQDEHAVTPEGSIFFTEAGTGQLFERINPTAEQSPLSEGSKGKCTDPAKACTIHISQSHRSTPDSAGSQPAAFQAASADGTEAFFTSPEKLTNDANTGPPQPPAQIEEGTTSGTITKPAFIPRHAIGVAVSGTKIYWADPTTNTIGRADLDGNNIQDSFIEPPPIECEFKVETEPGVFEIKTESVESRPRYVAIAVDGKYAYWTNTGCSDEFGAIGGTGTIGRANIEEATPKEVKASFIKGASNPQGIAVNSENIYWANSGKDAGVRAIAKATIDGGEVNQSFHNVEPGVPHPFGIALDATHVYFSADDFDNDRGFIGRVPLAGGPQEIFRVDKAGIRDVAVDGSYVYWSSQAKEAIGRIEIDFNELSLDPEFIPLEGKPNGLALDGTHLYWATNGEAATNPGNDLYRYGPGEEELEDLTPDPAGNGAEVQGVLAASADGKYVYFAANGVLAAGAKAGNCEGPLRSANGHCSLYLWHEGQISLVARLDASGGELGSDARNWAATPRNQFATASYVPKTSFTSADGQTLLFSSQEKLTGYENNGVPELYRFRVGQGISCVSCKPSGEAPGEGPKMGQVKFPGLGALASVAAVSSRNLSASGNQVFFETPEALNPADTNGQGGNCPLSENFPACTDVYEWEAPSAGTCQESSPSYSPLNSGCIYLISTGKSPFPSLFADASASGDDVFFFTRQALVGQDKDELQDVYDARVGGGLSAQNPVVVEPCVSTEACHGPASAPPAQSSPATPSFFGPPNEVQKHKKQKAKKKKSKKHKQKHKKKAKAKAKGRTSR